MEWGCLLMLQTLINEFNKRYMGEIPSEVRSCLGTHLSSLISYNSLISQNAVALSKQERISSVLDFLLQSSNQHNSIVPHNPLLNPRCVASSVFLG